MAYSSSFRSEIAGMEPLGCRFHPTDFQVLQFLLRFVAKKEMNDSGFITTNLNVYGEEEPWEVYSQGVPSGGSSDDDTHSYRYFITKKNNMYAEGTWKQHGGEKPILFKMPNPPSRRVVIGRKKKMHHEHKFGHWLMKQYELCGVILGRFDEDRRDYVLCAIRREYIEDCSFEDSTTTTS